MKKKKKLTGLYGIVSMEGESGRREWMQENVRNILALSIRKIFDRVQWNEFDLQEIRLRNGQPLIVQYQGKDFFLQESGKMSREGENAHRISSQEIKETLEFASNYSLYAMEEELRQGFMTIRGGHRIGVVGKVILEQGKIKNLRYISGINIRVAHERKGCADLLLPFIFQKGFLCSTLLISPPGFGKTTMLRDVIRQLSNGCLGMSGVNVGVVDERSEIGACYHGIAQNDLGIRTDILDGCPKAEGMMMLVRSMSPKVIAVDEIGSEEDFRALQYVMTCGVKAIASMHGHTLQDVVEKIPVENDVFMLKFQRCVIFSGEKIGEIQSVYDTEKKKYIRFDSA